MAYTDEDLQKITSVVKQSIINSGTNTSTASEIGNISDVKDILIHDKDGKIARITPTTLNADNVSRLQSVNDELVSRIQGRSVESDAVKDPFKFVGSFNTSTMSNFRSWLDNLHGTDYKLDNRGFYRATLNDSVIEITSSPINYTTEEYLQVVRGRVSIESTTGLLTFSYEYNILERKYSAADGWASWRIVASADNLEKLQGGIQAEKTRATGAEQALEQSINSEIARAVAAEAKINGTVSATFDFTTGSIANWQSRIFAYNFKAGNMYLLKVLTEDTTSTTYFSFRQDNNAIQNNLLIGTGKRENVFTCAADCNNLYMTIQSNGFAIAYNVEILNLSEISLGTIARETAEIDARTTDIERMLLELPTFDDFVAGYKLDFNGNLVEGGEYSSTEKFFYIPSNTEIKVKGQSYGGVNFIFVYDTTHKVIKKVEGQGTGVDVEYAIKYDYPVLIRFCVPNSLLDRFSISYDGVSVVRNITVLENSVDIVEKATNGLGKPTTLNYEDFEIGGITIDKTGWAYSAKNSRVRMKAGITYHLFVGDVIKLPDGIRAYLGFRVGNTYDFKSWVTNEFTIVTEGDYKILLSGVSESTLSSKFDLLTDVRIIGGERRYENILPIDADALPTLRVVNHRGFNTEAPENTLPAFKLSKLKGFRYVEVDVQHTADGVPVCIHDWTVERTSNGGNRRVDSMTFEEIRALDFGSWFSSDFAGTQIPTFEEFLILCKQLGLKPYVELKDGTTEQIRHLFDLVRMYGMEKHTTFISFHLQLLRSILSCSKNARVGYLDEYFAADYLNALISLREMGGDVFADLQGSAVTDDVLMELRQNGFEVEGWTTSLSSSVAYKLDGVTTDAALYWEYSGNRPVWYSIGKVWKE